MRHSLARFLLCLAVVFSAILVSSASAITIDTVRVGDAGNPGEPSFETGYGSVDHEYFMGQTEVTNAQYAAFLNAKGKGDTLQLFQPSMGTAKEGGISRTGVFGSYVYAVRPNMADKPVNFVTAYSAMRFANWMNNGQGTGDTETGAYTLLGGKATPTNGLSVTRNVGANWFLPNQDEWYKAAYYQPAAAGGDADGYWLYPTRSNTAPTLATANSVGDINNPGFNVANYSQGADWNTLDGNVTTVASAGPLSQSYYGTYDQGGNIIEWTETLFNSSSRVIMGGSYNGDPDTLSAVWTRQPGSPGFFGAGNGFRLAYVPEPSTFVLAGIGLVGLACRAARRRRAS